MWYRLERADATVVGYHSYLRKGLKHGIYSQELGDVRSMERRSKDYPLNSSNSGKLIFTHRWANFRRTQSSFRKDRENQQNTVSYSVFPALIEPTFTLVYKGDIQ